MIQKGQNPRLVIEDGQVTGVILDIDEYQQLLERLEEADDIAALQRMRNEPMKFRPLSDFFFQTYPHSA